MNSEDLQASSELITKDFYLESSHLDIPKDELTPETLLVKVTQMVDHLMTQDFNQLINVLYRIDISESKLKEALALNPDNTAEIIAQMIIERELQKVETRKKYS